MYDEHNPDRTFLSTIHDRFYGKRKQRLRVRKEMAKQKSLFDESATEVDLRGTATKFHMS